MTVAELIEQLQKCDKDLDVCAEVEAVIKIGDTDIDTQYQHAPVNSVESSKNNVFLICWGS